MLQTAVPAGYNQISGEKSSLMIYTIEHLWMENQKKKKNGHKKKSAAVKHQAPALKFTQNRTTQTWWMSFLFRPEFGWGPKRGTCQSSQFLGLFWRTAQIYENNKKRLLRWRKKAWTKEAQRRAGFRPGGRDGDRCQRQTIPDLEVATLRDTRELVDNGGKANLWKAGATWITTLKIVRSDAGDRETAPKEDLMMMIWHRGMTPAGFGVANTTSGK